MEIEVADAGSGSAAGLEAAAADTLAALGVHDGHVAVTLVGAEEIRALNREHRKVDRPTDVLSFPVDGLAAVAGPRELGDVVICPEETADLREAVVHGVLHLCGHDHETDGGEMLALQERILENPPGRPPGGQGNLAP